MLTTTNYGLKKPEGTDVVDIQNFNDNADIIDQALKAHDTQLSDMVYQTPGGAATALTLIINGTLKNGYPITFIASANNGGAATTINGKKLYKPATTNTPILIKDKAYTVWYNAAGDNGNGCFFIKASAEGDAIAANVLAGKKFSNDNDTGLVGTLDLSNLVSGNVRSGININGISGKASVVDTSDANAVAGQILNGQTAYINGNKVVGNMPNHSGADSSANSIAGTNTGRIYVRPQAGYYDGSVASYVDDGNFNAANIVSGKSIFGLWGNAKVGIVVSGGIPNTSSPDINLGFKPDLLFTHFYSRNSRGSQNIYQVFSDFVCLLVDTNNSIGEGISDIRTSTGFKAYTGGNVSSYSYYAAKFT